MKNLILIGAILLGLAFLIHYLIPNFSLLAFFQPITMMGILAGIGIGLIIGGLVGYFSKGIAMKQQQQKKEFRQLQKEKEELKKQAMLLAQQKENQQHNNPNAL